MMLERSLRLIQEMAASGAHLGYFFALLVQLVPYYVAMALPAAFMIALVILISKLDERLELEAMLASGVSLARIALPLVGFGALVAGAALLANGVLEPYGRYNTRMLRAEALHAARFGNLQPGAFYSLADGLTLSFRRRGTARGQVEGVFLRLEEEGGRELVLTAERASLAVSPADGTFQIALRNGLSYQDGDPERGRRAFSLAFRDYRINESLRGALSTRPRGGDQKELTIAELVGGIRNGHPASPKSALEAELYSRLARSLSAILLPLLAIPLSFAAKKRRRGLGIAIGGVLLMAFHHSVNTVKSLTLDGNPAPGPVFALLCGLFAAFALWLFVASRHLPSHGPLTGLAGRFRLPVGEPARPRARIVRLPGGTIGSYAAGTLALWTAAAAAAAVLLLQMVDFLERGDDFLHRGLGAVDVAHYAALRLPLLIQQSIAIAALSGAVLALLRLTRFSEMVAIRSAGISLRRFLLMLAPVALMLSAASYGLAELVTPRAERALAIWWRSTDPVASERFRWFRIGGDIARAADAAPGGETLRRLTLYRFDESGRLRERLAAREAVARGSEWNLSGVQGVRMSEDGLARIFVDEMPWTRRLSRRDVRAFFAATPSMSSADARRSLAGLGPVAEGPARFETRLYRAYAEPLAPLVMLLLAAPLALASSRSGPSWPRLLFPLAAGIAFLVSDGVMTVAAQTGMVLPWIGAWAAPLVFGLLAASILVYSDS